MSALSELTVLGSPFYRIAWLFVAYSFVGVVVEVALFAACESVLEPRTGLLYLPLRPLYGLGGCAFAVLLRPVVGRPVLVFVLGAAVATVLEYLASLLTELLFGAVSWDYRNKPLNVHGRICLAYSLCWGALALVAVFILDRPLLALLAAVPHSVGEVGLGVLLVVVLMSAVLTAAALRRIRARVETLRSYGSDGRAAPHGGSWDRLVARLAPERGLIDTFPRMSLVVELLALTGQRRTWVPLRRRRRSW